MPQGLTGPVVVKADGLAAGKGVTVCVDIDEARRAIRAVLVERAFGAAGNRVIVERALAGPEASVIAICDATDGPGPAGGARPQAHRGGRHGPEHRRHGRDLAATGRSR